MTTLMSAALPASARAHAQPPFESAARLPAGLTEADAVRIAAAISAARTESTRTVYARSWNQWERWCTARSIPALPGDPLALCAYLTERAEAGRAMGTLDGACTAIRHVHRMCGVEDPVASEYYSRVYGLCPRVW